ncbi:hypothetical protein [Acetobacter sicerae]|uniref:hypothetical protein n=1 Tax=Acetobacter sicerae TaxID=85325 RepID=UPI00156A78A9|nr:hypothetical protein [Acetobacter sicerae]NHN91560.1 hypothetical protein [Acetobacter sicerae]
MATILTLREMVSNAIELNENTPANELSLANAGTSGYSVGLTQYDFGAHSDASGAAAGTDAQTVRSEFNSLLENTRSESGLAESQVNTIEQNIGVKGGSSAITPAMVEGVNKALTTSSGALFTSETDSQDLGRVIS